MWVYCVIAVNWKRLRDYCNVRMLNYFQEKNIKWQKIIFEFCNGNSVGHIHILFSFHNSCLYLYKFTTFYEICFLYSQFIISVEESLCCGTKDILFFIPFTRKAPEFGICSGYHKQCLNSLPVSCNHTSIMTSPQEFNITPVLWLIIFVQAALGKIVFILDQWWII